MQPQTKTRKEGKKRGRTGSRRTVPAAPRNSSGRRNHHPPGVYSSSYDDARKKKKGKGPPRLGPRQLCALWKKRWERKNISTLWFRSIIKGERGGVGPPKKRQSSKKKGLLSVEVEKEKEKRRRRDSVLATQPPPIHLKNPLASVLPKAL